jgi:ribosomal protein L37AE/L43A
MKKTDSKGRFIRQYAKEERTCPCGKQFIVNSNSTKRHCCSKCANQRQGRGYDSPHWKGGRAFRQASGYTRIYVPGTRWKYMQEHRYIMEQHLGRKLSRNEEVHHINGIKDDNRLENLELVQRDKHYGKLKCPHCHKEFLIK